MYKVTVISGPNRGTSYMLNEGETSVGRQTGNVIVLPSAKVSKRHCSFLVLNGQVSVADRGSSNGTFVNGVLTKAKPLKEGDRVSVGDIVMEVGRPAVRKAEQAPALAGMGMPGMTGMRQMQAPMASPMASPAPAADALPGGSGTGLENAAPSDIKGKVFWVFERTVMPFFYGLNLKSDWKILTVVFFGIYVVLAMAISMYPLVEANQETIVKESGSRARFMARQIVEKNSGVIAAQEESKAEIGGLSRENGVVIAVLTDLDSRIIAPSANANSHLSAGDIGVVARKAAKRFSEGLETGIVVKADDDTLVAVEPLKVLNPRAGRNITVGMAVVALDLSLSTPDIGSIALTYSHSFIIMSLLGAFLLVVLYRLTLKRFEVLNEDLDKVLKGEMTSVTNEFKGEDFDQLWEVINSAMQRIPKDGHDGMGAGSSDPSEDFIGPAKMMGELAPFGVLVCDEERKILYTNRIFEEVAGIRASDVAGQVVTSAARDQAFSALVTDMFNQAKGGITVSEDFEFSGVAFRVQASAFGGANAKGYLLVAVKSEG
ncbi:MAG TPA: FHA domain-containing protein [Bdellovibrionota bacterium]|nr:FHA domain-containing protein [Bdellovibrionota bacterium]